MKILMVVFERNGLLWFWKKEEITAQISLDILEGKVNIKISDPKLRTKITSIIDFSKEDIKAHGVSEEATILNRIKNRLMSLRFNRTTPVEAFSINF